MAQDMGLGKLGDRSLIFKRKFRWTFQVERLSDNSVIDNSFVKLAARPNLTVEETEINRLNAKAWIPGKAAWETITVTYYDVATQDNLGLWNWLASVYDFTNPVSLTMGSSRLDYAARGVLTLFDGCGTPLENWVFDDMWPQAINFGELDYASSDEINIELTLRYSQVTYKMLCPNAILQGTCTPCASGASSTGSGFAGNQVFSNA